jgi:hypothetical protein
MVAMHISTLLVFFALALFLLLPAFYVWRPWRAPLGRFISAIRGWDVGRDTALVAVFGLFVLSVVIAVTACSAQQTAATATVVQDVSDAVCQELDANLQNEPAWLQFVCTAVDKQGNPHQFKVKMSVATAKKMGVPPAASSGAKVAP